MKIAFYLFLFQFIAFSICFSQDSVIHIDKIPPEGILLDKGWKFHAGDNLQWAKADFDDNSWKTINPAQDIVELRKLIPSEGICWFRVNLRFSERFKNSQLALIIRQSGASQIYLNGKLFREFGIRDPDSPKVKAFDPLSVPVTFNLDNDTFVIAVRYFQEQGVRFTNTIGDLNPFFYVTIQVSSNAIVDHFSI